MTSNFKPVAEQLAYLKKGVAEIIREDELKTRLEKSFKIGVPLRVYLGVDPTAPDIHLGHTVVLRKLKHFQDMGHTAVFLIGDFSAMIGDPTGRSETRPPLSREEVNANAKTYLDQVFKILDKDKTEVRYNSEWLDKLSSAEVVKLCAHYRLARMLEREDFRSRLENNQPISVHELLYPLLTAYDAVSLKSDVELGATEQKFNLLVHRDIQREYGLEGQVCVTMPILVGLDGSKKMSKSLGNYVGITETPTEMFGKLMSIPDDLMWTYYELLTDRSSEQIAVLKNRVKSGDLHPKKAKEDLAALLVDEFHTQQPTTVAVDEHQPISIGTSTAANFNRVFRDREAPSEMKEIVLSRVPGGVMTVLRVSPNVNESIVIPLTSGLVKWSKLLTDLGEIGSVSEAERLMKGNGFEINGKAVVDPTSKVNVDLPGSYEIRLGKKRFVRIKISI